MWSSSKYLTVDESMVGYNGRYSRLKQFMLAKPITHGIKLWAMACAVIKIVLKLDFHYFHATLS